MSDHILDRPPSSHWCSGCGRNIPSRCCGPIPKRAKFEKALDEFAYTAGATETGFAPRGALADARAALVRLVFGEDA